MDKLSFLSTTKHLKARYRHNGRGMKFSQKMFGPSVIISLPNNEKSDRKINAVKNLIQLPKVFNGKVQTFDQKKEYRRTNNLSKSLAALIKSKACFLAGVKQ